MNPRWLVLADEDFGRSVELSRTGDLLESKGEADFKAEECIRGGARLVYLFRLERAYVPQGSRFVEICSVELDRTLQTPEGYGGTD